MYLTLASVVRIVVQAVRNITLVLENNQHLELKDCLYVPKFRKNLIFVSSLNKSNYSIYFNKNVFIRKNDRFICSGMLVDNLFHITLVSLLLLFLNNYVLLKRKVLRTNQIYLSHLLLSYINLNRIQRLVKLGALHLLVP